MARGMVLFVGLVVAVAGCGDDEGLPSDASADPDGSTRGWWLEDGQPDIAAPVLTPCPEGWRQVTTHTGPDTCEPYPGTGVADCGPGEAHFVGSPGCVTVGSACPAGDFADDLPSDRPITYVVSGAGVGGDGTIDTPYAAFGTFSLGGLPSDAVLAVGAGMYDTELRIPAGVTVWGACTARTVLTSSTPSLMDAVVSAAGAGTELRNLTVGPSERWGIEIDRAERSLTLEGVIVEGNVDIAVYVQFGTLTAHDLVIRDTRERLSGHFGWALEVLLGAQAQLARGVIEGHRDVSVLVEGEGAFLSLLDVAIRDTRPQVATNVGGRAMSVEAGASAELSRVAVHDHHAIGLMAHGEGSSMVARDLHIARIRPRASDNFDGRGLVAQRGARLRAERIHVSDTVISGIYLGRDASSILTDVLVRNAASGLDGEFGRGISYEWADGWADRVHIEGAGFSGVHVFEPTGDINLSNLTINGRRASGELHTVVGVALYEAPGVTIEGLHATDITSVSAVSAGPRTDASFADILLEQVGRAGDTNIGTGFGVVQGASSRATRFRITDAGLCGVYVYEGFIELSDGQVSSCTIGACVTMEGFDATNLGERVSYLDNEMNLDSIELPVPDISTAVAMDP